MKKVFKLAFVALATLSLGSMMTSCDEENGIISIIKNLLNPGESYTYTGTAASQSLTGSYDKEEWYRINDKDSQFSNMQVTLKSTQTDATITIPAFTDGKVSVSATTIGGLTQTLNEEKTLTTLGIDMSTTTINGTITVDGTTYTIRNLYFEKAAATTTSLELAITLYYGTDSEGDNYSKAINFTYTGTALPPNKSRPGMTSGQHCA